MALSKISNGGVATSGLPTGTVLQVVNAKITSAQGTGSTNQAWVATSLTATITPTSATSDILIIGNLPMFNANNTLHANASVFRGTVASGTNLGHSTYGFSGGYANAATVKNNIVINYLDDPSTASAVTYTVAIYNSLATGGTAAWLAVNSETSTLTLMEIRG